MMVVTDTNSSNSRNSSKTISSNSSVTNEEFKAEIDILLNAGKKDNLHLFDDSIEFPYTCGTQEEEPLSKPASKLLQEANFRGIRIPVIVNENFNTAMKNRSRRLEAFETSLLKRHTEAESFRNRTFDQHKVDSNNMEWKLEVYTTSKPRLVLEAATALKEKLLKDVFELCNAYVVEEKLIAVQFLELDIIDIEIHHHKIIKEIILKNQSLDTATNAGLLLYAEHLKKDSDIKRKAKVETEQIVVKTAINFEYPPARSTCEPPNPKGYKNSNKKLNLDDTTFVNVDNKKARKNTKIAKNIMDIPITPNILEMATPIHSALPTSIQPPSKQPLKQPIISDKINTPRTDKSRDTPSKKGKNEIGRIRMDPRGEVLKRSRDQLETDNGNGKRRDRENERRSSTGSFPNYPSQTRQFHNAHYYNQQQQFQHPQYPQYQELRQWQPERSYNNRYNNERPY